MRKFLKNSILKKFHTMYEVHKTIKILIEKKDYESVQSILGDCKNTAIKLEEAIESSEGEGFVTVSYLEEYCEMIYSVSSSICDGYNGNKAQKNLDKVLIKAENSAKNDIKVKLEVVFLPYKASMWDSLESVWKAANDDPDCNAYVIPIPYYDRNPDGSFGEMHYEGAEYPDYVPIIHYESYDLEKMRPDVIYIHNPYDEYNMVTSVMECFYSSTIKKYTDKLVYIPYFVLDEPDPDNEQTLESILHFVITTGVINADEVIVQSEAMKQAYVKILLKQYGDTAGNRKMLDKKILGTGSPKFDKISNTARDDVVIPESWKPLIFKANGERKKVILYNICVSALLQNDEKMIEKIKSVLDVFYRYRDEAVLLWRPHPLIKATIESVLPHLWNEYKGIVDRYIADGWGIYDDTSDLDRAIALSDGYYGDSSSLVQLCQKAEMPVMIQSTTVCCSNRVRFLDCEEYQGYIWFVALFLNSVCRYNKATGETELVCCLEHNEQNEGYRAITFADDKIYIAPIFSNQFAVYDINKQSVRYIPFELEQHKRMPEYKTANFSKLYTYGKYVFAIPMSYDAIVRIDTETDELCYYSEFADEINLQINNPDGYWLSGSCVVDNVLYISSGCSNAVIEFDLKSCKTTVHNVGDNSWSYSNICYDGKRIWLLNTKNTAFIVWDINNDCIKTINLKFEGIFNCLVKCENNIVRIPCNGNSICDIVNIDSMLNTRTTLSLSEDINHSVSCCFANNNASLFAKNHNNYFYYYSTARDSLCAFDKSGNLIEEIVFELCNADCQHIAAAHGKRILESADFSKNVYTENVLNIPLSSFIQAIVMFEKDKEKDCGINIIGQDIYKNLTEKY